MVHRETFDDMVNQRNRAKREANRLSSELAVSRGQVASLENERDAKGVTVGQLTSKLDEKEKALEIVEANHKKEVELLKERLLNQEQNLKQKGIMIGNYKRMVAKRDDNKRNLEAAIGHMIRAGQACLQADEPPAKKFKIENW